MKNGGRAAAVNIRCHYERSEAISFRMVEIASLRSQ
jgi:hypothetical protein